MLKKITNPIARISLLISLYVSINYFYKELVINPFKLTNFKDRNIGTTILNGIDATARTNEYLIMLLAFFCIFILTFTILYWIFSKLLPTIESDFLNKELKLISLASEFSIILLIINLITNNPFISNSLNVLYIVLIGIIILTIIRIMARNYKGGKMLKILPNEYIFFVISIISYACCFIYWVGFKKPMLYDSKFILIITALICIFALIYTIIHKFTPKINSEAFNKSLILGGVPFALIPFSIPISNEIQFSISSLLAISARRLSLLVIAVLITTSIITFLLTYYKNTKINTEKIIKFLYPSIIIGTLYLYISYTSFMSSTSLGIAEDLQPTGQLFNFGSIPFIDTFSTHGISTMITEIMYSIVNGFRGPEVLIWEWIYIVFSAVITFLLLAKITRDNAFSFFFLIFLPINLIFPTYYSIIAIPTLLLIYALNKFTNFRFILYSISIIFMFLWRVDIGLASLVGNICILFILLFQDKTKIAIKKLLLSNIVIGSLALIVFSFTCIIKNVSIIDTIKQIICFVNIQAPNQSYNQLGIGYDISSLLEYIFIPIVTLYILIYFLYRLILKKEKLSSSQLSIIFLSLFSLMMSVRNVQRHSIRESVSLNISIFVICCFVYIIKNNSSKIYSRIYVYIVILLIYITPIFASIGNDITYPPAWSPGASGSTYYLFTNSELFSFVDWHNKQSRLGAYDNHSIQLESFLKTNLKGDETYFNFYSDQGSIMYSYINKKNPAYFAEIYFDSADYLQTIEIANLNKFYSKHNLPFVLFGATPNGNDYDSVPATIRSYKIAEYIYQHYRPLATVDNRTIWIDNRINDSSIKIPNGTNYVKLDNNYLEQTYDLMDLPYIWGNYDTYISTKNSKTLNEWQDNSIKSDDNPINLDLNGLNIDKSNGNYLELQIASNTPGTVSIKFDNRDSINFNVLNSNNKIYTYKIRISTIYSWANKEIKTINIKHSSLFKINKIALEKGD